MCVNINTFDAVDFSKHRSEEVVSFFLRALYNIVHEGVVEQCLTVRNTPEGGLYFKRRRRRMFPLLAIYASCFECFFVR